MWGKGGYFKVGGSLSFQQRGTGSYYDDTKDPMYFHCKEWDISPGHAQRKFTDDDNSRWQVLVAMFIEGRHGSNSILERSTLCQCKGC